jgi:HEAT repeat protein
LQYLPDEQALAVFENLWARDDLSSGQRSSLLQTLVLNIRTPAATQRVLDLWPAIPAGDSVTRTRAIERFGRELFEPAIPILGDALRDANDGVRRIAREAFAAFKEHREALEEYEAWMRATGAQRESIAQLVELLASPDREVLLGAVRALGAIRARTALPQLVRLLQREDETLRAAVHEAIGRMGE